MSKLKITTGYSSNNLPYMKMGDSPRILVVFEGLNFNHKPPAGMALRMNSMMFKVIVQDYTVYMVGRKPGLPEGYTMRDMSNDYAEMIRHDIGTIVNISGVSTGGPIAQWFTVDHPELVRKLVLISTGYRLSDFGKQAQLKMLEAARTGSRRTTAASMIGLILKGLTGRLVSGLFWLMGPMIYGSDMSDGIAELDAEDKFNFKERLPEIKVPTLVIGGAEDPLYLIRETAEGIPDARLILYENAGHTAMMKKDFQNTVLNFLNEE
ncbi:MAG: alpha/beta hydrolase [Dehalococcoidales bacterium]|nr:alpha/beta hydrolase [Dehalococcoidales bacterium]